MLFESFGAFVQVMLLGTMYPEPPTEFDNCTANPPRRTGSDVGWGEISVLSDRRVRAGSAPARNTYLWVAETPAEISKSPRRLAIDAPTWNTDDRGDGRIAVCDTNAAAAVDGPRNTGTGGPANSRARDGTQFEGVPVIGLWRHCETSNLHTIPHTFKADNGSDAGSYRPNVRIEVKLGSEREYLLAKTRWLRSGRWLS